MRLLSLLLLFLATAASADPITLQFWHSMTGSKNKLLDSIVMDFNHLPENQGKITVFSQFVGSYEEGLNKLRTALIGGKGPHLVQITDIGQRVMIDSGAIRPLQDFIDQDPTFPLNQILPPIRRYYEVKGKLNSLPFATSNPILYYNADMFKAAGITSPPKTFQELEDDARKLTKPDAKIKGLTWPLNCWFFEQFMARQGANLVNPDNGRTSRATEANYLSPEAIRFLAMWIRMSKEGTFSNLGRDWDPAEQNFLAGRTAMLITSTSDIFEVVQQAPFKLMLAPIPADNPKIGGTVIGGNSLWIIKNKPEAEQKAAYLFEKYLISPEVQEKWHTNTGYFPIRNDVIESLKKKGFYDKNPATWVAIEQMRSSPATVATQGALMGVFPEVRDHVATAIEEVLAGQSDIETAMKRAKAKTDFSLMRYNRGKSE